MREWTRGLLITLGAMVTVACGDEGGVTPSAPEAAPFLIEANLQAASQSVSVWQGGEVILGALVTVNGLPVPQNDTSPGYWIGRSLSPGPVVLEVTVDGQTAQATGNVPEAPFLTAPASGTVFAYSDSVLVAWSSGTDPDGFEIYMDGDFCCGPSFLASGTARELKIAATDLGVSTNGRLILQAINDGTFTGSADPDSRISLWSSRAETVITVTP